MVVMRLVSYDVLSKKAAYAHQAGSGVGAAYRNRTDDLFITSELLYRLS